MRRPFFFILVGVRAKSEGEKKMTVALQTGEQLVSQRLASAFLVVNFAPIFITASQSLMSFYEPVGKDPRIRQNLYRAPKWAVI